MTVEISPIVRRFGSKTEVEQALEEIVRRNYPNTLVFDEKDPEKVTEAINWLEALVDGVVGRFYMSSIIAQLAQEKKKELRAALLKRVKEAVE